MHPVLTGVTEFAVGGYESAVVITRLVLAVPNLLFSCGKSVKCLKRKIFGPPTTIVRRSESCRGDIVSNFKSGTCSLGLLLLLQKRIILRAPNGSIVTEDYGIGSAISDKLSGAMFISTEDELNEAIRKFKNRTATEFLDIAKENTSIEAAYYLWIILKNENLTKVVKPGSPWPEMALQGGALLKEEEVVIDMLKRSQLIVDDLNVCCSNIREKLEAV